MPPKEARLWREEDIQSRRMRDGDCRMQFYHYVASGCHPGDTVVAARRVGGFPYVVPSSDAETNALRNSVATKKAIQRLRTSIAARVDSMKDDIELNVLKQVTSAPTFCGSSATTRWCVITAHWSSRRCQPWIHIGRCCSTARASYRSASAVCTRAYTCRHGLDAEPSLFRTGV